MNQNNALAVSGLVIGGLTGGVTGAIIGGIIGSILQEIIFCPICGAAMTSIGSGWLKCPKCGHIKNK